MLSIPWILEAEYPPVFEVLQRARRPALCLCYRSKTTKANPQVVARRMDMLSAVFCNSVIVATKTDTVLGIEQRRLPQQTGDPLVLPRHKLPVTSPETYINAVFMLFNRSRWEGMASANAHFTCSQSIVLCCNAVTAKQKRTYLWGSALVASLPCTCRSRHEYLQVVTVLISYSLSRYLMLFSEELSKPPVVDNRRCWGPAIFSRNRVVACVEKVKERLDEQ